MRIELRNISKSYGDLKVIENFSATLDSGKIYQIAGPSGSGKTTLLNIIMGLVKQDQGTVDPQNIRISAVFQEDRLIESLSAEDNLKACGITGNIRGELDKILPSGAACKKVSELSGGMRRRVCIARAVLAESDLLIMDEPFSGIDEQNLINVIQYIMAHKKDRVLTITSHANIADMFGEDISVLKL
ncbi:MAG: ATP-binding cassette domain-containing protein [Clostridiales bacterium]|nr:ATP-binding cassette domain-containing protein [Clostridiales bacterium]